MAEALGVPIVTDPVYPYNESPPIDEVMSHIIGSSIQWGFDPRITSSTLTETAYLFLRVACHSLWPISYLHTIPLEWCVFLYAFMFGASISFPHLFLRSLNEVHRSSAVGHALIYPIFIHRIFLYHMIKTMYLSCFRSAQSWFLVVKLEWNTKLIKKTVSVHFDRL